MEPEEIDKLFRDKLAGRQAVPAPDAWLRLQQQMEPPKKQRTMWVYYAAASVVLLLVPLFLFLNRGGDGPGPAVATVTREAEAPVVKNPVEAPVERKLQAQQQPEPVLAQAPVSAPRPAARTVITGKGPRPVRPKAEKPTQQTDLMMASQPAPAPNPASQAGPQTQPTPAGQIALTDAAPDLSVVEVVVRRDAGPDTGQEDLTLREQLNRKGQLLKNIYKQARNLKNGEPVELATIGVDKGRIQEETKELKQKLTNVISL